MKFLSPIYIAAIVVTSTLSAGTCPAANTSAITLRAVQRKGAVATIEITHRDWPGQTWALRLPEYLIIFGSVDTKIQQTVKTNLGNGSITLSGIKSSHGAGEYSFVLTPGDGVVDIEATVTNTGKRPWDRSALGLSCLAFRDAPDFFDESMSRTTAQFGDGWESIERMSRRHGRPAHFRHYGHALRDRDRAWFKRRKRNIKPVSVASSLIIRSSADGTRHVAQAWDDAHSVGYNFEKRLNCTHSNPRFSSVGPGRTKTLHGRIYFFTGTVEELIERFEKEFPTRGYRPDGHRTDD